ncbi:MAG: helix-turn-helix domain-containing protein [Spirochaetales bacterium]|uniref:Helix-turn-helix domain-containing protein n=1 Tax=Candidatus Thalassospirochaeta sargassi TaxID=3119039 RepID=A0AAJ1MM45_9SPIO|nr:helix-turn-helix domain-containing protein [Spirochaetales bacterium]
MESISQKLVTARESLGYSIEQIARETNIAKSYLTALEAENFDAFPGETYLLGFLRNYSEYLGLDPEEMISLYRNMIIQEQPAPIEELLDTRKPLPKGLPAVIIILIVLGLAAAGYFYVYPNFIAGRPDNERVRVQETAEETPAEKLNIKNTYEFSDEVLEKRFRKDDAVSIGLNGDKYLVVIADIAESVKFVHPQGELLMKAGDEAMIDLDGDESADVRMLLRTSDPDNSSIVLHVDRFVQSSAPGKIEVAGEVPEAAVPPSNTGTGASTAGRPGAPSRAVDPVIIREADTMESFTLNIIFRGYCLLRYDADSTIREERYFHKSETFRLDVNSSVRLWASNAGALSAKVNGVDIDLGGSGEITARSLQWAYNTDSSKYELKMIPLY